MYDLEVFDIKEKWFKEAAPQNYSSAGSGTAGTPCFDPSAIIDNTNDLVYLCTKPDGTTKNTGWKKYKLDGGTTYDYEWTVDIDTQTYSITITPDASSVTLAAGDTIKVTLGETLGGMLVADGFTVASDISGAAEKYTQAVTFENIFTQQFETLAAQSIGYHAINVATKANTDPIEFIFYNSAGGVVCAPLNRGTDSLTLIYNSSTETLGITEGGDGGITSTFDVGTFTADQSLLDYLTANSLVITTDPLTANGEFASAAITVYTKPNTGGSTTIAKDAGYYKITNFAHAADNSVTMDMYVFGTSTWSAGYTLNT